jgi:hypothetical protein
MVSNKGGSFTPASGYTNAAGDFSATFTSPSVTQQTNVKITVTASKNGFADGSDYKDLEVLPPGAPSLAVQVTVSPSSIIPLETSNVTVRVTYNSNPVENAAVRISSSEGNLTAQTGSTDADGYFKSSLIAPQATTELNISITATATKSGYLDGTGQAQLVVNPEVVGPGPSGSGSILTTILLVLIPVVVVAVAAVLIIRKRRAMVAAPNPEFGPTPDQEMSQASEED